MKEKEIKTLGKEVFSKEECGKREDEQKMKSFMFMLEVRTDAKISKEEAEEFTLKLIKDGKLDDKLDDMFDVFDMDGNVLANTISGMLSVDYKERFKAEYRQLVIRLAKLETMLNKWKNNMLDFTPDCPFLLLKEQYDAMEAYAKCMRERAVVEKIDLNQQ